MVGLTEFFGQDEWRPMFLASSLLFVITGIFLLSRAVIWVAFIIFGLALTYTGYKLYKKLPAKYQADELINSFKPSKTKK